MAYIHKWLIENRILYNEYNGSISKEDITEMVSSDVEYLDKSDALLVHCLVNIRALTSIPTNIKCLSESTQAILGHPQIGWVIAYGNQIPAGAFITTIVAQLFKTRFRLLNSHNEALDFLKTVDVTLPDLQALYEHDH